MHFCGLMLVFWATKNNILFCSIFCMPMGGGGAIAPSAPLATLLGGTLTLDRGTRHVLPYNLSPSVNDKNFPSICDPKKRWPFYFWKSSFIKKILLEIPQFKRKRKKEKQISSVLIGVRISCSFQLSSAWTIAKKRHCEASRSTW